MRFCIVLGAAKSGTTSLFHYLAQHPEIAPCSNKEPNYFSSNYDSGDNWYFSLWDKEDIDTKVLLEATVNYTGWPTSPKSSENMLDFAKKHNVDIKFIYIMRDPVIRFESHHTYNYAHRSKRNLEDSLKNRNTISCSRYAEQMDLYFDKFNHDNFLLLMFDELKSDPQKVLKKTCIFLGINPDFNFQDANKIHNKTEGTVVAGEWNTFLNKHPFVKQISNLFPKELRRFIFRLIFRKKVSGHFKLSNIQKQKLHDILKDDMVRLHEKYGIDVSKWGF